MHLFRFTLPTHTNAGLSYELARKAFSREALKVAGGFTEQPIAQGVWEGDSRTYRETVVCYDVATDTGGSQALLEAAFRLFPDQEAIFVADLGSCAIHARPPAAAAAAA